MSAAGPAGHHEPRVVVLAGDAAFANVGDVAMAGVAIDRVRAVAPAARISVVASGAARLEDHGLGTVVRLADEAALGWARYLRTWRARAPRRLEPLGIRWATTVATVVGTARRSADVALVRRYLHVVQTADLIVVAGQGGLHDGSAKRAGRLLDLLRLADASSVPVVMVGQGVGPIRDPHLAAGLSRALAHVRAVGVRDPASAEEVRRLGGGGLCVEVTGDDAFAVPLGPRVADPGSIGLSLRANAASAMPVEDAQVVADAVREAAGGGPVEALTMMELEGKVSDRDLLSAALGVALPAQPPGALAPVAEAIGRCRVVVTGTYHGAVLAAAAGVPVVALAWSDYYRAKMRGVAVQLPDGAVEVVDGDQPDLGPRIVAAVARLSARHDDLGPALREACAARAATGEAFARAEIAAALGL